MTDTDEFLAHFGVKGMKWGRRNSESSAREARDDDKPPSRAKAVYNNAVVKAKKVRNIALAGVGAGIALRGAAYVAKNGPEIMGTVKVGINFAQQHSAQTKAGAKFAGKMLGDLGKSLPYAKIAKGAYKVTSLK